MDINIDFNTNPVVINLGETSSDSNSDEIVRVEHVMWLKILIIKNYEKKI